MRKTILLILSIGLAVFSYSKCFAETTSSTSAWAEASSSSSSASASANSASANATADGFSSSSQAIIENPPEGLYPEVIEYYPAPQTPQPALSATTASNEKLSQAAQQTEANTSDSTVQESLGLKNLASRLSDIQNRQIGIDNTLINLESWTSKVQKYYLISLLMIVIILIILAIDSIALRKRVSELEA
ncbi:MAG: hypothetical protein OEV37_01545 [Candidatus Berkelbacteria bacterium]|nr:hypothetical protein [Candidatus Berkelbacteria bacterium]